MAFLVQVNLSNKTETMNLMMITSFNIASSPPEVSFGLIPTLRFVGEYTGRIAGAAYRGCESFSYRAIIGYSSQIGFRLAPKVSLLTQKLYTSASCLVLSHYTLTVSILFFPFSLVSFNVLHYSEKGEEK